MNKNTPILVGLAVSFLTFSNVTRASHIEHECHKGTIQYIINKMITTNDCENYAQNEINNESSHTETHYSNDNNNHSSNDNENHSSNDNDRDDHDDRDDD